MKISPKTQDQIRQVMEERVAFNRHLGLRIESFDPEAPKLRLDMRAELVGNPTRRILHGGVISATLDVAAGLSILMRLLKENPQSAASMEFPNMGTVDIRVDYLRPGRGSHFIATGRVVRLGKRIAVTHMELVNDAAELIATGSAAYVVG